MLALKLCKKIFRHFAKRVDKYIESSAVGHTYHHLFNTATTRCINNLVHAGNKRLTAFEGKALLANVFRVQVTLESFGRRHLLQNLNFLLG